MIEIKQVDIDFDIMYPFNILAIYESGPALNYIMAQSTLEGLNIHKAKNVGVDKYRDCESFAFTVLDVVLVAKEVFGGTGMNVVIESDRFDEHKYTIDNLGLRNVFVSKPINSFQNSCRELCVNIDHQFCSDLIQDCSLNQENLSQRFPHLRNAVHLHLM